MTAVLDSSVAVKWYAAETGSERAADLIGRPFVAPDLIRIEVAHALWRKVQRREIARAQAEAAMPHLASSIVLLPTETLFAAAFAVALDIRHAVYDCIFLCTARFLELPLLTADEALRESVRGTEFERDVILLDEWEPGDD